MSYNKDLRKKAIEYLAEVHTQRQARDTFHISLSVVNRWSQQYQKTGNLEDKKPCPKFKKLDPEKLKAYANEHPDSYLKEIGEAFGCSDTAVIKALRRLRITHKKRQNGTANKDLRK